MNSIAYKSPIVEDMIGRILYIFSDNINLKNRHVLNADLVPKFKEQSAINKNGFQESLIHRPVQIIPQKILSEQKPLIAHQRIIQKSFLIPQNSSQPDPRKTYRKIFPLLKDPLVQTIECFGPNIPLNIMKGGFSQRTNIVLNKEEIEEFLKYSSEQSKIPLISGAFKAIVDDFYLSAYLSDSADPKFLIKKQFSIYDFV